MPIPPGTVRAQITAERIESGNFAQALYAETKFKFDDSGVPLELSIEGKEAVPINCAIETGNVSEFFRTTKGKTFESKFPNEDARRLLSVVYDKIANKRLVQARRDFDDNEAIDPDISLLKNAVEGCLGLLSGIIRDSRTRRIEQAKTRELQKLDNEAWIDTTEWMHDLINRQMHYTSHDISIEIGGKKSRIKRIIIGEVPSPHPDELWDRDRILLDTLVFAHEELSMEIPSEIFVYSLAHTDGDESVFSELRLDDYGSRSNLLGHASKRDGTIVCIDRARQVIVNSGATSEGGLKLDINLETYRDESQEVYRHELAHLLDGAVARRYLNNHIEGFATAVENAFDTQRLIEYIHYFHKHRTRRVVNVAYLENLMSSSNKEQFLSYETYEMSGALFSFIASKLGYKAFSNFYKLLTGQSVALASEGSIVAIHPSNDLFEEGHLSTERSLRNSLRATMILEGYNVGEGEKTTDEVIYDYLQEFAQMVNQPKKKTSREVGDFLIPIDV
jgi:hypothetical protein